MGKTWPEEATAGGRVGIVFRHFNGEIRNLQICSYSYLLFLTLEVSTKHDGKPIQPVDYSSEGLSVLSILFILLHAARRAMAAAPLLPGPHRYYFY